MVCSERRTWITCGIKIQQKPNLIHASPRASPGFLSIGSFLVGLGLGQSKLHPWRNLAKSRDFINNNLDQPIRSLLLANHGLDLILTPSSITQLGISRAQPRQQEKKRKSLHYMQLKTSLQSTNVQLIYKHDWFDHTCGILVHEKIPYVHRDLSQFSTVVTN